MVIREKEEYQRVAPLYETNNILLESNALFISDVIFEAPTSIKIENIDFTYLRERKREREREREKRERGIIHSITSIDHLQVLSSRIAL